MPRDLAKVGVVGSNPIARFKQNQTLSTGQPSGPIF